MRTYKNRKALNMGWNHREKHIIKEKISLLQLQDLLNTKDGSNGSLFVFTGIVRRDKTKKGVVKEIIYEAYEEMAEKEIEKITKKVSKKFKVGDIFIKHRIGSLLVGEISLLVAVLSPHRKEGIQAVDYVVDKIKKNVQIWKKEIFEDCSYRWK